MFQPTSAAAFPPKPVRTAPLISRVLTLQNSTTLAHSPLHFLSAAAAARSRVLPVRSPSRARPPPRRPLQRLRMLSTVVSSSRQKREIRQGKRDLATEKEEQERKLTLRKREQVRKLEAREKEVTKREREVAKREKELKKERERLRVLKERLEGPETELGKSNKEATDSSDNSKKSDSDKSKESDGNNSNKSDGNSSKNGTDGEDMVVDDKPKASGYGNEIDDEDLPSAGRAGGRRSAK